MIPPYVKVYAPFMVASLAASLLGSSVVHHYYKPLADFEDLVRLEMEELMKQPVVSETQAKYDQIKQNGSEKI